MVLEHARCRNESGMGEKLDSLIEKELNNRIYSRCVGLANLQAKMHSLEMTQVRLKILKGAYSSQEERFDALKAAYDNLLKRLDTVKDNEEKKKKA